MHIFTLAKEMNGPASHIDCGNVNVCVNGPVSPSRPSILQCSLLILTSTCIFPRPRILLSTLSYTSRYTPPRPPSLDFDHWRLSQFPHSFRLKPLPASPGGPRCTPKLFNSTTVDFGPAHGLFHLAAHLASHRRARS